jgi:hypothetical protein
MNGRCDGGVLQIEYRLSIRGAIKSPLGQHKIGCRVENCLNIQPVNPLQVDEISRLAEPLDA